MEILEKLILNKWIIVKNTMLAYAGWSDHMADLLDNMNHYKLILNKWIRVNIIHLNNRMTHFNLEVKQMTFQVTSRSYSREGKRITSHRYSFLKCIFKEVEGLVWPSVDSGWTSRSTVGVSLDLSSLFRCFIIKPNLKAYSIKTES